MFRQPRYSSNIHTTSILVGDEQSPRHYSLPTALPPGHTLSVNSRLGILSYLISEEGQPRIVLQDELTATEVTTLLPLLDHYPDYCPLEALYACFYRSDTSVQEVDRCRQHLFTAQQAGTWDQEMRPLRGAVSRVRLKLHHFGIDVLALISTGYILSFDELRKHIQEQESRVIGLHRIS
jgi:hypothetical protein